MKLENTIAQMKKGVLELCILSIVESKDAYPSDITERLTEADLIIVEGTLYPLLTRLKNFGFLDYYWQESNSGPPRKYYKITDSGKIALEELKTNWNQFITSVNQTIQTNTNHE